ncbi:cytochrome ubiquinol oxidase subunit I [Candidatus Nitrospira neomarina]|uniref:Cytochrome ubiquinol oxidase subunit I n=1 Tax=Candidatus Nitrospira neomarina TaxID=3020899 RepID=A0AA96GM89_9BACT|nr:cytochrome ubiquinol oxidase subunit I [Candidatus Nitrospira neomarina]WNM62930.1 cytochrome ubiquinol oxidase subunit I [Candidatus Nitrospira neomarina]
MASALLYDRLQFAFTVTFHYLFPQLTIGLALLLLYLRSRALVSGDDHYNQVARFWTKIFALSFAFGVVTGIPLEFQFGTNWAKFSNFAGGVIGQTLAMEGLFAFFLESSFLGILLFGEGRFSQRVQWAASLMLFLGSWLSGYFILATNAWMQHPVAYTVAPDGRLFVDSLSGLLTNPWLVWQFAHNMTAAVVTASFVVAAVGSFYLLSGLHVKYAKTFLRTGVVAGAIATALMIFPTGHENARQVFEHQPVKGAAFEGLFKTERGAGMVLIGQPNLETMTIDNPLVVPDALSLLLFDELYATVRGLEAFPRAEWPDNVALLYYAYHVMALLGTILVSIMGLALFWLWQGRLFTANWLLWLLMLSVPFPYLATTAGWMTAELGRQPWLVYGLLRTADGASPMVHSGNALFTLLGYLGIYLVLGLLFLFLMAEIIRQGPAGSFPESANP